MQKCERKHSRIFYIFRHCERKYLLSFCTNYIFNIRQFTLVINVFGHFCNATEVPEVRSYRVVTAVMNWQQKRGLALWMFCRVGPEPGTILQ